MSSHIRLSRFFVAIALIGLPAAVDAQTTLTKSSVPKSAYAKAIELHQAAVVLYADPARAADAARLHVQEASFRTQNDPEAVNALIMAAHMYNYAKQPINARKTMVKAAERALGIGDVERASQAYIDATFLADKVGNMSETQRLGRKALLLAESPVLQEDQRIAIQTRFRSSPKIAKLLK